MPIARRLGGMFFWLCIIVTCAGLFLASVSLLIGHLTQPLRMQIACERAGGFVVHTYTGHVCARLEVITP